MILYHATTPKKARLYHQTGCIKAPVRGFTTHMAALMWALKVGRSVIYKVEGDPAYKMPDHHNQYGHAWWIESDIPICRIKCMRIRDDIMKKKIEVIKFVNWDMATNKKYIDCISLSDSKYRKYRNALIKYLIENKIKVTGWDYQKKDKNVPIMTNNIAWLIGMRGWGGIMAEVWNAIENTYKYNYMDFYCHLD